MTTKALPVPDEINELRRAVYDGNAQDAKEATEKVLKLGHSIDTVLNEGLFPPMTDLGDKLRDGEIFIPEVLMSSRAMQAAMHALLPVMTQNQTVYQGTVIIGTVAGDLHDIGKNLVALILRAKGFSVFDLGIDVTAEEFVDAIKRHNPVIVGISAMLTTTLPEVKTVIEAITEADLRSQVTIMVGGAPVSKPFARKVNADIYAETLFEAAKAADELINHQISKYVV